MNPNDKKTLRAISLELRHTLEGTYDDRGRFQPGDLERRLNAIGVWRDRPAKPLAELTHLPHEDQTARQVIDAYLGFRAEAGVGQAEAVDEFVREAAYNWANRLLALRCMEARGIIDEVILQKEIYGRRSMVHNRLGQRDPALLAQPDEGLFTVLLTQFRERARELPGLFNPKAPAIALRPSLAALKKCIGLLSGTVKVGSYEAGGDELFAAPDALGWAYQYWNAEEKDRVFEKVRTKKGAKIAGADIIPATQLYTEPYMVKFLVQNSLGALWQGMYPDSDLADGWDYYVRDADRAPVDKKPVGDITFLDPACGSGHFHLEAFDLLYAMYEAEAGNQYSAISIQSPEEICAAILNRNLYGIDIDERAIQIAQAALWMKAKEKAWELEPEALTSFHHHFVATNIRLPRGKDHLETFLRQYPEERPLRPALETVFEGLENAHELGSLLQLEEPVEKELRYLQDKQAEVPQTEQQGVLFAEMEKPRQGALPFDVESYDAWKTKTLARLRAHFEAEAEAADLTQAFFGQSVGKGLALFDILAKRYDIVVANPPYMGSKNMSKIVKDYVTKNYSPGKRDLFGTFILRCVQLATKYAAMITLNSWLSQKAFLTLREKILESCKLQFVVQLGRHAFSEADPPGFACLFSIRIAIPTDTDTIFGYEHPKSLPSKQQALLLEQLIKQSTHTQVNQFELLELPDTPILVNLPDGLVSLITTSTKLADIADVPKGMSTANNDRFLRCFWEVYTNSRWYPYAKGGTYCKWYGLLWNVVDYENNGIRLKSDRAVIRNEHYYGQKGLTYTEVARGSFGVRALEKDHLFDARSPGIFATTVSSEGLATVLNSRFVCFFFRQLSPGILLDQAYAPKVPVPKKHSIKELAAIGEWAIEAKKQLVELSLSEYIFDPKHTSTTNERLLVSALLATCESFIDSEVFNSFAADSEDKDFVMQRLGYPPGWYQPINSYDMFPLNSNPITEAPQVVREFFEALPRHNLSPTELQNLKSQLQFIFELGSGSKIDPSEIGDLLIPYNDDDIDNAAIIIDTAKPIPTETFLEEISARLQIHPISIYWLLKEGIEQEGWRCPPEEKRLTEDRFTVAVLRLLGHRWPKQIEANEPIPDWAEPTGIIPITGGILHQRVGQASLLAPNGQAGSLSNNLEREFADIVGEKLADWLAGSFFTRHISQFKKRPIAWQLQTSPAPGQRRRGEPAFAVLLYYHKLSADLLPTLRSQFVRDLVRAYETEQRTLRQSQTLSSDQETRLQQLDIWLTELHAFSDALHFVSEQGFGDTPAQQAALRQYALDDAMQSLKAAWLGRLADYALTHALPDWQERADATQLHPEFRDWIAAAIHHLPQHCANVGPKPPQASKLKTDPDAPNLATIIGSQADRMVSQAIALACDAWFDELDAKLLKPLLEERKEVDTAVETAQAQLGEMDALASARYQLEKEIKSLQAKSKKIRKQRRDIRKAAKELRAHIGAWHCPEAAGWTTWLGQQPLFDQFTSLDGKRPSPQTIAEFISQESRYVPDINDGVRVNIAPLQKAGLLAADVLAAKDVDKAIADRADWRADERRWCREGKLPRPGWWV